MRCPSCGFENLAGDDRCSNCGADLWSLDTPREARTFEGQLLGERLDQVTAGEPATIGPAASASTALERMRETGSDCLLVMADDRLVGIFTERDAVLKLPDRRPADFDVRDLMTRDPVVLRADDTLAVAIHKMAVGGFRHIPLMDGDRPVAVVSATDLFRHILGILG